MADRAVLLVASVELASLLRTVQPRVRGVQIEPELLGGAVSCEPMNCARGISCSVQPARVNGSPAGKASANWLKAQLHECADRISGGVVKRSGSVLVCKT